MEREREREREREHTMKGERSRDRDSGLSHHGQGDYRSTTVNKQKHIVYKFNSLSAKLHHSTHAKNPDLAISLHALQLNCH